jgi:L-lactate dehydrogenase complex protein LldF
MRQHEEFQQATGKSAFDREMQAKVNYAADKYEHQLHAGSLQFANLELARDRAAYVRWKVIENLDKYLIEFESAVIRRGGKVLWANDAETALHEIDQVIAKRNATHILKTRTSIGDEIGLHQHLHKKGIRVSETDLGDFITSQAGEAPFHMVTSAMHKNKEDIARLLNAKISSSMDASAEELSLDVRAELRDAFIKADISISGANFLVADSGMVALTENEGNIRLSTAFVQTHIVLAGIEKIIPSINDLDLMFPLLSTYGSGQKLAAYNTIAGPRGPEDEDGPAEFIVILIDNGRSGLLAQPDQRQGLACINCGACQSVCPVFRTIGGHAYGTTYTGPIGSLITPHLSGMDEYKHLSNASSLCGKCTDVCPVKIDLHNHLLRNRRDVVQQGLAKSSEKLMWFSWKKMMLARKNMNKGTSIKSFMLKSFFRSGWGERREFPKLADKSFNQLWRERQ